MIRIIWLVSNIVVLVAMILLVIRLNKQVDDKIKTCKVPLEATVTWWETSIEGGRGIQFFLVLSILH